MTIEDKIIRMRLVWMCATLFTIISCTFIIGRKVERAITAFQQMQETINANAIKQEKDKKELLDKNMRTYNFSYNLYIHQIRVDIALVNRGIMQPDGMMAPEDIDDKK